MVEDQQFVGSRMNSVVTGAYRVSRGVVRIKATKWLVVTTFTRLMSSMCHHPQYVVLRRIYAHEWSKLGQMSIKETHQLCREFM